MKFLFLLFFQFAIIQLSAQVLSLKDFCYLSTHTETEGAQFLISKSFVYSETLNTEPKEIVFYYGNGQSDSNQLEVRLLPEKDGKCDIQSFFAEKFDKDYKSLEAQLKKNKVRFYFDSNYNLYWSDYKYNNCIFSVTRGIMSTVKSGFKYGSIFIY